MPRNPRLIVLAALLSLASGAPMVHAQAVGDEFQVNTWTTNDQSLTSIGASDTGDFVVVWTSFGSTGSDSSDRSMQGQRFASDGSPQGAEFQINSYTFSRQEPGGQTLAVEPDGDFVVVWQSEGSAGSDSSLYSVQGQRFASDGSRRGGEFQVNTYTSGRQQAASVAVSPQGDFVVLWQSAGSANGDPAGTSVQGQRYASDGSALGSEFLVNTYTPGSQGQPTVAVAAGGDFVAVWVDHAVGHRLRGQRYASDGSTLGGEFQVTSYTRNFQYGPSVAVGPDGGFVVSWSGPVGVSGREIVARRFASDGTPLGADQVVNSSPGTGITRNAPDVDVAADGSFVISWQSDQYRQDHVLMRRFSSSGAALEDEVQVSKPLLDTNSGGSSVATLPAGEFVVTWHGSNDGSGTGIFGRRFTPAELTVTDSSIVEGDVATFTVTLSATAASSVTVNWSTTETGGATSGSDYTAASGTLTLAPGQFDTFEVSSLEDAVDEGPEYFYVRLTTPSGSVFFTDSQARGQISDDDPAPVLAFATEPVNTEADSGTTPATFTVTLTGDTERTVDVDFATGSGGTALSGVDYAAKSGSLRFSPGQTSKLVKVFLTGDTVDEARETYVLNLSSPLNATIGDTQSTGTIVDNDPTPEGAPSLSISDTTVTEGTANASFTVSLSATSAQVVAFTYGTGAGGTAQSGGDYLGFTLRSATIQPGQLSRVVTVPLFGDELDEPNETFFLNVTSASNAAIVDGQGRATIVDDDAP